jgi:hypothetical protein
VVDTAGRDDAVRWERLAQQAALEVPPPYRPEPGQPVYQISADGHAARRDLLSCRPAARQQGGPELGPTSPTREHLTGWRGGDQTGQVLASLDPASRGYRH